MQRFSLKKVNEVEVMKQYKVKISNRLAPLENLGNNWDIIGLGKYYRQQKSQVWPPKLD
jgi:hypothetical protein